jgi:hypothetical protein
MDREAEQELHQKSLRNVRALLDKEEEELARQKKAPKMLLYAFIPAIVLVAVVVIWGVPGSSTRKAGAASSPKLLECQMRVWAEMSGEREREIRSRYPNITPGEVGAKLQQENANIEQAALRRCEAEGAR